ncbi:hypothetical protein RI129_005160 [Pyrocoelia pectoralis]|uniref:Protein kinase C-binding protein 1 n=1 Tax=Pyrocoelia pectoralis TaxID=417401 RepID=A0AAN7VKF5_9COLE
MSSEEEQVAKAPLLFDVSKQTNSNFDEGEDVVSKVMVEQVASEDIVEKVIVEHVPPIESEHHLMIPIQSEHAHNVSTNTTPEEVENGSETIENGVTTEEQDADTPKSSRELKSLLALSKEANLDTNIAYKRKSVEPLGRSEITSKRRYSTGSSNDSTVSLKLNQCDESHQSPHLKPEIDENSTNELNLGVLGNKELKIKQGKKVIEGAVDENGVRNRNLSTSFVTFNNEKKDAFCWQCHHSGSNFFCKSCPRSFHQKCLRHSVSQPNHWLCPECVTIMQAENLKQRSSAMRNMTLVHLCVLLKFALKRMLQVAGCEPFIHPVNDEEFPDYKMYIIRPMDVTCLEKNIKKNLYGSPQAFESEAKWILHNSIIFNSYQSKLTSVAKSMLKICKQEMVEIENCATCYLNANTKKKTWFVEVCPKPHIVVWAKLKGFPYWPAKAMKCNSSGMVDVRFFGAHDRAWVHYKECFLFSMKDPNSNKQKKHDIIESVKELQLYVENLKKVYGEFRYADYRVQLEPENLDDQLKEMIPSYPNMQRTRKSVYKIPKSNGTNLVNDEPQKENEISVLNVNKATKSDESSDEDNVSLDMYVKKNVDVTSDDSVNHNSMEGSPFVRSGNVRMRGGITNTSGKIKVFQKLTPEHNSQKRLSSEEFETPTKFPRLDNTQSDDTLLNCTETLGDFDVADNTNTSMESNLNHNLENKQNITSSPENQINCKADESSEITSSIPSAAKISDRLMKKLSESEKSMEAKDTVPQSPATAPTKEPTEETDIFLEKFIAKGLTVLEKITELSADTEIFETDKCHKENGENEEFTKHEQCDDIICTEVDLEDKNNLLLSAEMDTNDDTISSSMNVISEKIPESSDLNEPSTLPSETIESGTNACEGVSNTENITEDAVTSTSSEKSDEVKEKEVSSDKHAVAHVIHLPTPLDNVNKQRDIVSSLQNTENSLRKTQKEHAYCSQCRRNKEKDLDARPLSTTPPITAKSILENRLSNITKNRRRSTKSDKDNTCSSDNDAIVVKSEPSSEDEPSDSEYLEKKRKYLSALNISEKLPEKPKQNEIRTRSKTEERTFKIVDNLSKVIDDVATHYSIKHEIFIKPLSSLQEFKQRARKSFPSTKYMFPTRTETVKVCKSVATPVFSVRSTPQKLTLISKSPETSNSTKLILTPSSVNTTVSLLPPNQPITYTQSHLTPILNMIQSPSSSNVLLPPLSLTYTKTTESHQNNPPPLAINIAAISKTVVSTSTSSVTTTTATTPLMTSITTTNEPITQSHAFMDEVRGISASVPENVSRAINDIMCGTPPRLKPRPPGPLSTHFDEGIPSSAGSVTSKVNSISHRLNDYFRGMLIELLHEVGTVSNPEAEITRLKLENEELKCKHSEEILEIKKNISSILKDMQKSLTDEKERAIEETRSACELETLKRVEDAKSKQWCASCSKEAQFYCCWNTSYCDYPCQQKHWSTHMPKCTQQIQNTQLQNSSTSSTTTKTSNPQPLVLRPTTAPKGFKAKTIIGKSTKVLVNRPTSVNKTSGNHITLVESTPGNYELLGSGGPISVGGKIIANFGKKLSGSVLTVASTANSNLDLATVTTKKITLSPAQTLLTTSKASNSLPEVVD